MPVILDTDHLTVLHSGVDPARGRLTWRLESLPETDVFTTVVSFQEQIQGRLALLNRSQSEKNILAAYFRLRTTLNDFCRLQVLDFDLPAQRLFTDLRRRRVRIGTMDLRIASIALSCDFTLLSRNFKDFQQVKGLRIEDWTL